MANFVQALAAGLFVAAAVFAQPAFSHRVHLAQKLECAACHTSVARSVRVEDNNLPQRAVCLGCHPDATIKAPAVTALARFSHQVHVRLQKCTACHAGIETSEKTSKANFPPMAACVTCHNQTDIPNGCWKCHDRTMRLEPESHVKGFIDTHSRGKMAVEVKQGCSVCHGQGFRCAGCH